MHRSALIALLLATAFGIPATAASTLYNINFSGSGVLPTAGSFTYNAGTSTFSAFSVTWDSFNFDLTNSANSPNTAGAGFPPCIGGLTGGAATFAMLSGACNGAPNESTNWSADAGLSSITLFQFLTVENVLIGSNYPQLFIDVVKTTPPNGFAEGVGSWTISAVTATPEPSMAILLTIGLAGIVVLLRKRVVT